MKKSLVLAVLLPVAFMLSANAQVWLYKGIKSGMSEAELIEYLGSDPDFTHEYSGDLEFYEITISGKLYYMRRDFNRYSELYVIDFIADAGYPSMYDKDLRAHVDELVALLTERYGAPFYEGWDDQTELSDGNDKILYMFGTSPDIGCIKVEKNSDGTWSAVLIFEDVSRELLEEESPVAADTTDDDDDDYIF